MGDEEDPSTKNAHEKSVILAPFNSLKSEESDLYEIQDLMAPNKAIKFLKKCREPNRVYEQNNNGDMDNGVYNECINDQSEVKLEDIEESSDDTEIDLLNRSVSLDSF